MSITKRTLQGLSFESLELRQLLSVTPKLVGDFNSGPAGLFEQIAERQSDSVWLNGELFFAAADASGDVELWKSDGSSEGTVRVADISPGAQGSMPRDFIAASGRVLFTAYSDEHGRELWTTDGRVAGTVLVKDLTPGTKSSDFSSFTSMGGLVYFSNNDGLFVTDSTDSGTRRIAHVAADALISAGDQLFLIEDNTLWSSDGTEDGTHIVKEFDWIDDDKVISNGELLYFAAREGNENSGLWVSDGTVEGTQVLAQQRVGTPVVAGEFTFFDVGNSLWRTDGTPEGTEQIKAISYPRSLAVCSTLRYAAKP